MVSKAEQHRKRIPKRFQIETIYGCNATCVMCALKNPPARPKGSMDQKLFCKIVNEMAPYADKIEKVDLFGLGEPILDPRIFDRIRYMRERGFRNLAISTNADLLDEEKQKALLDTRIETVIFSVDGTEKETHEAIRNDVIFERVVENCEATIRLRDKTCSPTRFVMRFIRQPNNRSQSGDFFTYWSKRLSFDKNDLLIAYDMNTMGGEVCSREDIIGNRRDEDIEARPCHQVYDRLIILRDGTVPLCCEDTPKATYTFGNASNEHPLDIFNCEDFMEIRQLHAKGDKNRMPICRSCTLLYSEQDVEVISGNSARI